MYVYIHVSFVVHGAMQRQCNNDVVISSVILKCFSYTVHTSLGCIHLPSGTNLSELDLLSVDVGAAPDCPFTAY